MDWLAEKVLDAIEQDGGVSNVAWFADKREEYATASRLEVLRWICHSLDSRNQICAARAIGVSLDDLRATARVLQKI